MSLLPIRRASDFITTSTSFKRLLTKVEPELTISKIASARPIPGETSTEPVITCISAFTPCFLRYRERIPGYEVAIFLPSNHCGPGYSISLGNASDRRHLLNPKRFMISASSAFSINSFSPTIPKSATPVATVCGISSSRKNNTSKGKLEDCTNNVRLVALSFISDSSRNDIVSSKRRPLACTAILNMIRFTI